MLACQMLHLGPQATLMQLISTAPDVAQLRRRRQLAPTPIPSPLADPRLDLVLLFVLTECELGGQFCDAEAGLAPRLGGLGGLGAGGAMHIARFGARVRQIVPCLGSQPPSIWRWAAGNAVGRVLEGYSAEGACMSDLVQPTADQQESLLAHLREGFLIWSALQIVGVSREAGRAPGPAVR